MLSMERHFIQSRLSCLAWRTKNFNGFVKSVQVEEKCTLRQDTLKHKCRYTQINTKHGISSTSCSHLPNLNTKMKNTRTHSEMAVSIVTRS